MLVVGCGSLMTMSEYQITRREVRTSGRTVTDLREQVTRLQELATGGQALADGIHATQRQLRDAQRSETHRLGYRLLDIADRAHQVAAALTQTAQDLALIPPHEGTSPENAEDHTSPGA